MIHDSAHVSILCQVESALELTTKKKRIKSMGEKGAGGDRVVTYGSPIIRPPVIVRIKVKPCRVEK